MKNERGAALLLVITLTLLLAAVGAVVAIASRTETLLAAQFLRSREALYAAEGAAALALHDLDRISDWGTVLTGAVASSLTDGATIGPRTLPGGDTVTLCCGATSLTGDVQRRAGGGRNWGDDTPEWQIFAWGPVAGWLAPGRVDSAYYVVVWVADDPDDGDGNPAADANGVLVLYAQALGSGGGRRVVEVVVRRPAAPSEEGPAPRTGIVSWREVRW